MPRNNIINTTELYINNELANLEGTSTMSSVSKEIVSGEDNELVKLVRNGEGDLVVHGLTNPGWEWFARIDGPVSFSIDRDTEQVIIYSSDAMFVILLSTPGTLNFYNAGETTAAITKVLPSTLSSIYRYQLVCKINYDGEWQWVSYIRNSLAAHGIKYKNSTINGNKLYTYSTAVSVSPGTYLEYFNSDDTTNSLLDVEILNPSGIPTAFGCIDTSTGIWSWTAHISHSTGFGNVNIIYVEDKDAIYIKHQVGVSSHDTEFYSFGSGTPFVSIPVGGFPELCIAKLDSSGIWKWVSTVSVSNNDDNCILYHDGDIYMGDNYTGSTTVEFLDYGSIVPDGSLTIPSVEKGVYYAKLNDSGHWEWVNKIVDSTSPCIYTDNKNLYVLGRYTSTINFFDNGFVANSELELTPSSSSSSFVAKLSFDGKWVWSAKTTGRLNFLQRDIIHKDNLYIPGDTYNSSTSVRFFNSDNTENKIMKITSDFTHDGINKTFFFCTINKNGEWEWTIKGTGGSDDSTSSNKVGFYNTVLKNDNIYLALVASNEKITGKPVKFYNKEQVNQGFPVETFDVGIVNKGSSFVCSLNYDGHYENIYKIIQDNDTSNSGLFYVNMSGYNDKVNIFGQYFVGGGTNNGIDFYNSDSTVNTSFSDANDNTIIFGQISECQYGVIGLLDDNRVLYDGIITLSGLESGKKYYFSKTSPFITTEENNHLIGIALSDTQLLLKQL